MVDVITGKAYYFEGEQGAQVREGAVPAHMQELVTEKRRELVEMVANVDETLGEMFLADTDPSADELSAAIRRTVIKRVFTPVFMGSALKNKGVQPLLDGVVAYLPNPSEVTNYAIDNNRDEDKVALSPARDRSRPFVGEWAWSGHHVT